MSHDSEDQEPAPVTVMEIGDVLDLHTFAPRDVGALVGDYIGECHERGMNRVRIIHGKGIGNLRRTVHAALERHDQVESYALADETAGGWGATIVTLRTP
jgi:dsDNA-specific endonuclease/ATPase MutS2